jgi:cyclopropane-fatty-acyl-phospholipid synthase
VQYPLHRSLGLADRDPRGTRQAVPELFGSVAATRLDRWCLSQLVQVVGSVPVQFVLWDGTAATAGDGAARFTVRVGSRSVLWRLVWDPDLGFGEAYVDGELQVQGDMPALLDAVAREMTTRGTQNRRLPRWLARLSGAGITAARRNAQHHYDLGNDFYRLWLDDDLVYTCAYFPTPEASLEAAQRAKLEHVCRKLHLEPGVRVIEAGCGWGALARYMASEHGARVRAWNVSTAQLAEARARATAEGLDGRVEFVEDDWRRINGTCDVFASIGMLEHVGRSRYGDLGRLIDRCLDARHGRGLLHFIGRDVEAPASRWTRRYVFPGFYLPTLREVLAGVLEPYGFSVLDVEDLRRHYALTLEHWRDRFERAAPQVSAKYGERFTRLWRYYLCGAHAGFAAGYLQLFQVSFARRGWDGGAWRRSA